MLVLGATVQPWEAGRTALLVGIASKGWAMSRQRGHVRKRGASWVVVLSEVDSETGDRKRRYHSCYRTKQEAEQARTELLGRMDGATYVPPSSMTVGEYLLEKWLPAVESTLRPATFRTYRLTIEAYVIFENRAASPPSPHPRHAQCSVREATDGRWEAGAATLRPYRSVGAPSAEKGTSRWSPVGLCRPERCRRGHASQSPHP